MSKYHKDQSENQIKRLHILQLHLYIILEKLNGKDRSVVARVGSRGRDLLWEYSKETLWSDGIFCIMIMVICL